MHLFDKCRSYTLAREAIAAGYYPYFIPIEGSTDTEVIVGGERKVMIGSNNYLGLTHHPRVVEAARAAIVRYGTGCTGSRFLNGNLDLHERLEARLARFVGKEAALVFSTGYQCNLSVIDALVGRSDRVYLDKLDHASIVDGGRMTFGDVVRFNHGDLAGLERLLGEGAARGAAGMIVVDGVFSMEGEIADLPALVRLAKAYGAALCVDDAHALGVLGPTGAGTAEHFGLTDEVDLIVGTFSKSFASIGGFIAGPEPVIHYLRHHARSLIFSASIPPASAAAVLAALDVIEGEPERRERLLAIARRMIDGLRSLGFDVGATRTPIVPVIVGDAAQTFALWRELFDAGVFVNAVVSPAVRADACRIRTSYIATHTDAQIDQLLDTFARVGRRLGLAR
ncbi:MAG: aminotransferase class I/II-fold pyridoxal phosphate-dependent enzyme [Polyangiaceae bacterium]|nr:aminotransferase class I/II-fold pyridoxal phosphate-dependent enzyme [Polyangiaceae bacterium]